MKIAIADDEELVRYTLRTIIEEHGSDHRIYEVENGEELIDAVLTYEPDLTFVDIRMPLLSGLDALERLKPYRSSSVFVILSGHSEFSYARQALSLDVTDYLLKPVDPREVHELLEKVAAGLPDGESESVPPAIPAGAETEDSVPALIARAEKLIRLRYHEAIGVAQIAEELMVTPNYLSAQFKRHLGVGFNAYITEIRLREATRLLAVPGATVRKVAAKLGYSSSRHFARIFRHRYQITPSEYLARYVGDEENSPS